MAYTNKTLDQPQTLAEALQRIQDLETLVTTLHALVDHASLAIFAKDLQGYYTVANPAFGEIAGYSPEELIGKDEYYFFPQEAADILVARERPVVEKGEAFTQYEDVATLEGIRTFLTTKFPIYDAARRIVGLGAVIQEQTQLKQAEAMRDRLQEITEAQQQALKELSTPIIPVVDTPQGGIIVMPLIGSVDSLRAKEVTRALLKGISQYRAKVVILDITGVPLVDSGVANHLNKTMQAARLKGARTIVTGVSDAVAETIVDLGIDWSNVQTLRDLQTGLVAAMSSLGIKLSK